MTFDKLFAKYMKSVQFKKLKTRSKQLYLYGARGLCDYLGDKPVEKIRRSDLLRFQQEASDKPAYANVALRVASIVFSFGLDMEYVDHNPAARIKKLKVGSHTKWMLDEVKAIIALHDRKISTAVALAWYTGQRESDVLNMRWADFDGEYLAVKQEKTNLDMKIKVHPDLALYLNRIRGLEPDNSYIVSGPQKMGGPAFRNMFKRRTDKLGIKKVFHGIRKGVASSLAENGSPISEIAALMGHKSIRMAAYYAEQANSKVLTDSAVRNLSGVIAQAGD